MLDEERSSYSRDETETHHEERSTSGRAKHGGGPSEKYAFHAEPLRSIARSKLEDPGYLVKGLMPSSGLHVLYGPPGLGKSFLALDVALHVAAGKSWAGKKVSADRPGVIYVAAEGSRAFKRRVKVAMKERGIDDKAPFLLVTRAPNLADRRKLDVFIDELKEQCAAQAFKPRLIILDTLARSSLGLDESSSKDMGFFVENAAKLSREFAEALIMPVHHTGKDVDKGMRGSSALNGAADAVWQLRQDDRGLNFYVEKMKDGPSGLTVRFSLVQVACGRDRDGDPITTQVVAFPEDPVTKEVPAASVKRTKREDATLQLIADALRSSGRTTKQGAPKAVSGLKALLAEKLYEIVVPLTMAGKAYKSEREARVALQTSLRKLVAEDRLRTENGWYWLAVEKLEDVPF